MSTCNRLDLQTVGSQLVIYAQNPPRSLVKILVFPGPTGLNVD